MINVINIGYTNRLVIGVRIRVDEGSIDELCNLLVLEKVADPLMSPEKLNYLSMELDISCTCESTSGPYERKYK